MTARAIFRASFEHGPLVLPLKLYSAVERSGIHFRLLHAADGVPIKQRMVDPETGAVVPQEQYQRAHLALPEKFVVLSEEERASFEPSASRAIELLRVLPAGTVSHQWYVRPYYLGPDGSHGVVEQYFAFSEALGTARLEL